LISAAFDRSYSKQGRFDEDYKNIPKHLKLKMEKKWAGARRELVKNQIYN